MYMRGLVGWGVALTVWALGAAASAQPLPRSEVPEALEPWIEWALDGDRTFECALMADGSRRCLWPGQLAVRVLPSGAEFEMAVLLDAPQSVLLPGDERRWPLDVEVDGRPVPVDVSAAEEGMVAGRPLIDLPAGEHRIEGRFTWVDAPETLTIPPDLGRISLTLPEGPVALPRRNEDTLWLQTAVREAAEEDSLTLEVFRRIDDGVPLRITTQISIRVAGRPREVALGPALLMGAEPISVSSDAPARMTESGELTVQVQAGTYEVTVVSARASIDEPLRAVARSAVWPEDEIWVWGADESLRQVELSGADRIDPDRTNMPTEWRTMPTYLVGSSEGSLELTTTLRGNPAPPPNQIELTRELWLDPDGVGLTGHDSLSGTMHRRWRLELAQGSLGRAIVNGEPHLISTREDRPGVEIRRENIDVDAEWRDPEATTTFSAVGWDEDVQRLNVTLRLAPGFRLIAASGPERANSWLSQWDLWALFYVIVIALALGRLVGFEVGAVAVFVLVLSAYEDDAPWNLWAPLVVVLGLAVNLPKGRVRDAMRWTYHGLFALLCLLSVYFAVAELRRGIWPLSEEERYGGAGAYDEPYRGFEEEAPEEYDGDGRRMAREQAAVTGVLAEGGGAWQAPGSPYGSGESSASTRNLFGYEPNAVLQTGPGLPGWSSYAPGRTVELTWDGPVTQDSQVRLWLLSPLDNAILAVLEVALLALLLVLLYRKRPRAPIVFSPAVARAAPALAAILAVTLPCGEADAQRDIPDQRVLEELAERLTRDPECAPGCADISTMSVAITGSQLVIDLVVAAGARSAIAIPGPIDEWLPSRISIGRDEVTALARLDDNYLRVRVEPGVSTVRLEGPIPASDSFTLSFAQAPHHVTLSVPGWDVDGLRHGDQVGSSIQLRRSVPSEPDAEAPPESGGASVRVVPWLSVERTFSLGIRWEVTTRLVRMSSPGTPLVVRIPLLPDESVLEANLPIENGRIVVTLGGTETEKSWTSVLTPREELVLNAPADERRSETWRLSCGTVWRCETSSLDPTTTTEGSMWQPLFRPFPGDTLRIAMSRLPAAAGQSMTIDRARLSVTPGERLTSSSLNLSVRSSIGTTETITLPENATLQSVRVNGERRSVEQRDRQVTLTIAPGQSAIDLEWQEQRSIDVMYRTPEVGISGGAVNVTVSMQRPSRWILWLAGPPWGPSVLFWPYLAIILAVAVGLSRLVGSKTVNALDWVLLALGLSVLPWQVVWVVPVMFALIEWRRQPTNMHPALFDLRQLFILGWTFVTACVVIAAIFVGLRVDPDTSIVPRYGQLEWYVDRIEGEAPQTPSATIVSLPTIVYQLVMLLWALWLAARVVSWGRSWLEAFTEGGLFRSNAPRPRPAVAAPAPVETAAPPPVAPAAPIGPSEGGAQAQASEPAPADVPRQPEGSTKTHEGEPEE